MSKDIHSMPRQPKWMLWFHLASIIGFVVFTLRLAYGGSEIESLFLGLSILGLSHLVYFSAHLPRRSGRVLVYPPPLFYWSLRIAIIMGNLFYLLPSLITLSIGYFNDVSWYAKYPPTFQVDEHIQKVFVNQNGENIALLYSSRYEVWNTKTHQMVAHMPEYSYMGPDAKLAFTDDGKYLVANPEERIQVWEIQTATKKEDQRSSRGTFTHVMDQSSFRYQPDQHILHVDFGQQQTALKFDQPTHHNQSIHERPILKLDVFAAETQYLPYLQKPLCSAPYAINHQQSVIAIACENKKALRFYKLGSATSFYGVTPGEPCNEIVNVRLSPDGREASVVTVSSKKFVFSAPPSCTFLIDLAADPPEVTRKPENMGLANYSSDNHWRVFSRGRAILAGKRTR